jgi:hypothetical protein
MRKSKFSESKIAGILKELELGSLWPSWLASTV